MTQEFKREALAARFSKLVLGGKETWACLADPDERLPYQCPSALVRGVLDYWGKVFGAAETLEEDGHAFLAKHKYRKSFPAFPPQEKRSSR